MLESHRNSQHLHENSNWCSKKTWEILPRDELLEQTWQWGTALLGGFYGWGIQEVSLLLNPA